MEISVKDSSQSILGIQPIEKSIKSVWADEFSLPGRTGQPYATCGSWLSEGCLNVIEHNQETLDGQGPVGKVYVRRYQMSCKRAVCPVCFRSWARAEAEKIDYRLKAWRSKKKMKVIHVSISPPLKDVLSLSYSNLRKKAYKVARKHGFIGGSLIFHPFRKRYNAWVFSAHFHLLGYGWIRNVAENFKAEGWIVKNHGIRKSVKATAFYQLTHAGIHDTYHSVTWFGSLAYNKLKISPMPEPEPFRCPICRKKLVPLMYVGDEKLPEKAGFYWLEPDGFFESVRFGIA